MISDHILHSATRPGYANLPTGLLYLSSCKSASLRHPAATAHSEGCGPKVAARIRFRVLTLAYPAANTMTPHYLQDIIQAYTPARPLRSAATGHFAHPASRATGSRSSRLRSFSTLAPQWWNDLTIPIRPAPSLPIFCRSLKTHLFTLYLDSSAGVP